MFTLVAAIAAKATIVPYALRCEGLTDPLGIDRTHPSFSWKVKAVDAKARNLVQSGYEVRVASEVAKLRADKADLWNTGKVASAQAQSIEYKGTPLKSGQMAYWQVRLWDREGTVTDWSKPAKFSMGLLEASDWKAKWIAYDAPAQGSNRFGRAHWIWSKTNNTSPIFTKSFELKNPLAGAELSVTVDDQFVAYLDGKEVARSSGQTDAWKKPVTVKLADLSAGRHELKIEAKNNQDAGGLIARLSGGSFDMVSDATWSTDGTTTDLGAYGQGPWNRFDERKILLPAVRYRKEFATKPKLKRATAYVTALGLVDVLLNGKRISEDLFSPGWTNYKKRTYYKTYDVTKLVKPGQNAIGAEVGDGWFSGYVGYGGRRALYGERPRLKVQLELEYADGSKEMVATDRSWHASHGPVQVQDFLWGEEYDARKADDYATVGYAEGRSLPVQEVNFETSLEAFPGVPVRPYKRMKPIEIKKSGEDTYVIDFGQNLAGFVELKTQAPAGTTANLQFVEILNPDGTVYLTNLRGARAIDKYTFSGKGTETWSPRFTFHGFRYVEVKGLGRAPKKSDFTAVAISSATPEVGWVETSDKMLNQLTSNAWWTQKMNFIDVPTDCPQRDERLGWTGDAQAYIKTASYYSDVQSFFGKWLVALDDDQRPDGQFPRVAPVIWNEDDGGPAWADAGVICPWTVYEMYGDKRQLAEHYPAMVKFVDFCRNRSKPDLLPPDRFHCFGDWLSLNADTPNEVIYEAYFAGSAKIVADAARALGKPDDAAKYDKLYDDVKAAFNRAYVSNDGTVKGNTQCAYVLALQFDLLDEAKAKIAAQKLVSDIESRNWHLSTGFVGTRDLMQVLTKIGRADVAFRLLHNKTYPSWGFEIVNGATTVWERWDGWTPEKGFQDPGMNSFAHYAYGAVMGWVYGTVGGINPGAPGFTETVVAPLFDPNLSWAKVRYDSVQGEIATDWKRVNGDIHLTVIVPANVTAKVKLPTNDPAKVTSDAEGAGAREGDSVVYRIGSGRYSFIVKG